MFSNRLDIVISKIILKKLKIYYFNIFLSKNTLSNTSLKGKDWFNNKNQS